MGLDMYLFKANKSSGARELINEANALPKKEGSWGHETSEEGWNLFDKAYELMDQEEIAYWRKDNHIHRWFVENVQNSVDDCGYYHVSKEKLQELEKACDLVLKDNSLAENFIPTQDGFFFGSTEYDEYYYDALQKTKEAMEAALILSDEYDFFYHSSW
jgi:hypothetical protein